MSRVWVVEYRTAGGVDGWGLQDLRALGFRETMSVQNRSSVVFLYVRP